MQGGTIKLLIIEDDVVDRMAFKRLLGENGRYDYRFAASLAEARALLRSDTFDIIVTDYHLGDGSGFELFDEIDGLPVIVMTGRGDEETAVAALKSGAYDYLIKDMERNYIKMFPVTVENVLRRLRAEELNRQKEKLRGVVEMAGAACHELNQPLQAISGYSELLMMEVEEGTPLYEMALEIKHEADRLARITRKLNNITRYETTDYTEKTKIIDLDKAAGQQNSHE